jgi:hypothetical protein
MEFLRARSGQGDKCRYGDERAKRNFHDASFTSFGYSEVDQQPLASSRENCDMKARSRIALLPAAAMATFALAGCGGDKATLATFAGGWQAHARSLKITPTGNADEWLTLGLGGFVVELRFRLSQPKGTQHDASATATVAAVRIGDRSAFAPAHPVPHVGDSFRIRLRDGVITEPLTDANYCGPGVDWPDAGCGA